MYKFLDNSYVIIFIILFWFLTLALGVKTFFAYIRYQDKTLYREEQFVVTGAEYNWHYDSDKDKIVEKYLIGNINKVSEKFYHPKEIEDCDSQEALLQKFKLGTVINVLYNDNAKSITGKMDGQKVIDISHNFEKDWDWIVLWSEFFLLPSVVFLVIVIIWGNAPEDAVVDDPSEFKGFRWRRPRLKFRRKLRK